jgi:hypothetical protein
VVVSISGILFRYAQEEASIIINALPAGPRVSL